MITIVGIAIGVAGCMADGRSGNVTAVDVAVTTFADEPLRHV